MLVIKKEDGFTLVELVVSVALLSGVLACIYYFFFYSVRSHQFVQDHYQAELSARNVTRTMSKEIRSAKAVEISGTRFNAVVIKDSGMTMNVYTDIDNDSVMELVTYKVVGDTLKMGTAELGSTPTMKTIVEKIGNSSLTPKVPAFSISGKRVLINLILKDNVSSLKEESVSINTSVTVRTKEAIK